MTTTYANPSEAYAAIDGSLRERIEADDELAMNLAALPDEDLADVKTQWQAKQREDIQIDTGRTRLVDAAEPGIIKTITRAGATMIGGGLIVARSKEVPITRQLEAPEVEADWQALTNGDIGLEDLSADEAKNLQAIAIKQEPELAELLKTDPTYLKAYARARQEYTDWVKTDGYYDTPMNERDRGFLPEAARKFMGTVLASGFAAKQWAQRLDRVEFGNPDGLSPSEIRERAEEAAIADMMPQIMGVRTFDERMRSSEPGLSELITGQGEDQSQRLTFSEKAGGVVGELASYVAATPNKLAFDIGMKGGASAAAKAGLKGWQARLATYGAGGAALGVKNTLETPAPSSQNESLGEFAGRLTATTAKDAAIGAAFGEVLHHTLAGLGYAWSKSLGRDTPLMRTVQQGEAQQFTDHFFKVAQRVEQGTANASERASFNSFSQWAQKQKIDLEALKRGEIGMQYRKLVPREWTEQFPMLRRALPDSVERVNPRGTTPPRDMIPESSRPTGQVPPRPEPKPGQPVEGLALPGVIAKPPASSPAVQGAATAGAQTVSPKDLSPEKAGQASNQTPQIVERRYVEPPKSSKEQRMQQVEQLKARIEAAPSLDEAVAVKYEEVSNGKIPKDLEYISYDSVRSYILKDAEMVEVQSGGQTLKVPNYRESIEGVVKKLERNARPYNRATDKPSASIAEALEAYKAAPDEGTREAALQSLTSNSQLKEVGLDGEYVRYKGAVIRREAVEALKSRTPGEYMADRAEVGQVSAGENVRATIDKARADRPAGETDFQRYALQLNEITQLAQDLGKGRYPQILEIVKRNPEIRGVFRSAEGEKSSGKIQLKADTFEVLTPEEIAETKAEAFDVLFESWIGELEASGQAGAQPPAKSVFGHKLESDPALQGRLKRMESEMLAEQRREIAPEREPYQAVSTLAHEIGHWIDFLPEGSMARGNILGRIASVSRYYKKMLPAKPSESGDQESLLSAADRQKLRRQALKQTNGDKMEGAVVYQQLVKAESEARGLIRYEDVRSELEALTAWWRLGGNEDALTDYHRKPEELYADAFSVLVNAPHELAKRAPTFYGAFEAYLERKGAAAEAYESLQSEIRQGTGQPAQVRRLRAMLSKDTALLTERDAKVRASEIWDGFTSMVGREFQPLYRRAKRESRAAFKRTQSVVSDYLYRATAHELYLTRLNNEILRPLSEVGVDMESFDEYMFHQHLIENRNSIANPLGWTAKTSTDRLNEIETKNPVQFAAMKSAQDAWWEMRKRMVIEPLRDSNVFNPALMERIEQQAFYTPFKSNRGARPGAPDSIESLLKHHFGRDTGLRLAKQIGQLGEIKSPTNQLMGIDLRLMDLVKRNAAKAEVIRIMQKNDPKNIAEAETRKVRVQGRMKDEPVDVENSRVGTLYLMKDGDVQAFYLPKALTVPFNSEMNINSAWYMKMLYHANTFQKSVFTQLNPGFWPVAVVRDVLTRYRKMPSGAKDRLRDFAPVGLVKDSAAIAKAFPAAWRSVRGEIDADAQKAMERGMVISRRETLGHSASYRGADIDRALLEFDKDPRNYFVKRAKAEKKISQALGFWLSIGQAFERAPKIATMKYIDEQFPHWSEWQKRNFVRQHGGSPDFLQRGTMAQFLDLFALFHNPAREGWMSEPDAAIDDAKGYAARGAQVVLPSLAFKLAGLGLLGGVGLKVISELMPWVRDEEDVAEMFQSISHYDLTNYDVVPLGWIDRENKKVLYFRIPKDETSRLILGAMMQPALEGEGLQNVLSYAGGNTRPHPLIGLLSDWKEYGLHGQNPYDSFMQRNVIDPTKFKAGEGTEDMLRHTWNQLGGSIVKRLQPERPTFTPKTQVEQFLDLPGVQNVVGRWFKVSNAGQRQRIMKDSRVVDAGRQAAQESLIARDIVEAMVSQKPLSNAQQEAMLYHPEISEKVNRYLNATAKRSLGPEMEAYESLQTKEEKAAALQVMGE